MWPLTNIDQDFNTNALIPDEIMTTIYRNTEMYIFFFIVQAKDGESKK